MKKILTIFVILLAIVGILGVIAPTEMHVEREVLISKPKETVFAYLKSLKNSEAWSPWAKRDPNMIKNYVGTDGTVGFISSWTGNDQVGEGEQEIKNILEGERIDTELRFKKPMESTSRAYLITESVDANQTKVKWGMQGNNPFPGNVICFVLNMKKTLMADFDEGLKTLKEILEK